MSGWLRPTSATRDEGSLHPSGVFSDRERIFEYLRERSAGGARNVIASIRETVKRLEDNPLSGYKTDNPEVRVIFVVRYPYKIFYRVRDEVEILHIRHTSRRAWTGDKEA